MLLDRERCVLCARCTRFSQQIAGDPFIELFERGALQQVAIYADQPFESYFSGNTVQICPVGALTGAAYRFRARPFDLVSSPMVCEHCAAGCALRTDHRRGKVLRRLAGDDPQVNEEWNCDKGRWAFTYATQPDRITTPLVRDADGRLRARPPGPRRSTSRPAGSARPRRGRRRRAPRRSPHRRGRLRVGASSPASRSAPTTSTPASARTATRSSTSSPARSPAATSRRPTPTSRRAPAVLLVGFEPEEESPIVFLRLRKAVRRTACGSSRIAPFAARGARSSRRAPAAAPCPARRPSRSTPSQARSRPTRSPPRPRAARPARRGHPGRRAARQPRPARCRAAAALAAATGARLAWVPRRAGERGAVDAGALPTPAARRPARRRRRRPRRGRGGLGRAVPGTPGRDLAGILDRRRRRRSSTACWSAPSTPSTSPTRRWRSTPSTASASSSAWSCAARAVTDRADVVLPVAAAVEKAGTYLDWEGRARPFEPVLRTDGALTDAARPARARRRDGRAARPARRRRRARRDRPPRRHHRPPGRAHRAPRRRPTRPAPARPCSPTWHRLLDDGVDAGRRAVPRRHRQEAAPAPVAPPPPPRSAPPQGELVTVSTDRGALTLPLVARRPARPASSGCPPARPTPRVRRDLAAARGAVVRLSTGAAHEPHRRAVLAQASTPRAGHPAAADASATSRSG